jgi:hypothetical protein
MTVTAAMLRGGRLTELRVGSWVRREGGRGATKGHYVESVVDHDAFTRCGRRLRHRKRPPLVVHAGRVDHDFRPADWSLCSGCR